MKKLYALPVRAFCMAALFLAGVLPASATNAQAADSRWYQVEVIVFKRQQQDHQEQWPTNIRLGYPTRWVELQPQGSQPGAEADETDAAAPAPFVILPRADYKLVPHANALQRDRRFQVLFHQAWRQSLVGPRSAPAVLINGGASFGSHKELEGSITLSFTQFIQLQARLWLTEFEANQGQEPGNWPSLPPIPFTTPAAADDSFPLPLNEQQPSATTALESDRFLPSRIVVLQEERRIRSNELHYLDHPLFGLIIQLTPYQPTPP